MNKKQMKKRMLFCVMCVSMQDNILRIVEHECILNEISKVIQINQMILS